MAALATASLLLAGCGSDGDSREGAQPTLRPDTPEGAEPTLDTYFGQLADLRETYASRAEAMGERAMTLADDDLEGYQDYFREMQALFAESVDAVKDLDPPPQVRTAHDAFVAAQSQLQVATGDLRDRVESVGSVSDLVAVLRDAGTASEEANAGVDAACRQLQTIAGENGIDVDLKCGEAEQASGGGG